MLLFKFDPFVIFTPTSVCTLISINPQAEDQREAAAAWLSPRLWLTLFSGRLCFFTPVSPALAILVTKAIPLNLVTVFTR